MGTFGWIDDPIPVSVSRTILVAAIIVGAGFVAGWRYRVSGPLFAVLLLFALTARDSWGQVWHTENLLLMHVGVLAFAPRRRLRGRSTPDDGGARRRSPAITATPHNS